ncbi:VWA domain-containing protein [Vibrio inusitatus NBRC 102082]|uniref:VWA domain-containing protein n=1 Tax=Vibrio inusitatus NBRC 102082 TaxID=1219070 RepID=A0A4Y3HZV9_9VIBR|nr:VWA domain-containing protein [Vibrio inusitatus]GEA52250.1 VWA domain-containing protein [Vibrio inusitatus NBRC 102082]
MTLLTPWWLLLGLLAPCLYWVLPAYRESDLAVRAPFFQRVVDITGTKAQPNSSIPHRTLIQKVSLVVTWCLLVVCTAQPVLLGKKVVQQKSSRDLMVALDLSKSMNKKDFPSANGQLTSRWQALEDLMQKFGSQRKGDRLGLTVFGSGAYLQVPFTDELTTWTQVVGSLSTEIAGPATAIGDAIGLSIRAFEVSQAKQKVLILVTDGSDTSSQLPPVEAAKVAKAHNISIHTIAMGDPATQDSNAKVDIETLKKVSALTGGESYLAIDKGALEHILAEINRIEQSHYQQVSYQPYNYLYPYILMVLVSYYFVLWLGLSLFEVKRRKAYV